MGKKRMMIQVRGEKKHWSFTFYGDQSHVAEWVSDGLDIAVVENEIPEWVVDYRLTKPWCFFQDLFNFKNPWA